MGRGSRSGINYIVESVWGTTPSPNPAMIALRRTTDTLGLQKTTFQSQELRTDRMIAALRHGNYRSGGQINFEWSYGSQDDFLESAMFSTFAVPYNLTGKTIAADESDKTFTVTGGGLLAAGLLVGDKIVTSGFANGANSGTHIITTLTDTVITCAASTLTDEAGGGNEAITTTQTRLKAAVTQQSLTVERAHADLTKYIIFEGWVAGGMALSLKPNSIVTGSFTGVAKNMVVNDAALDASVTAAPTGDPFDAFTGSIYEGGSVIAIVTGIDLNLENALNPRYVLFNAAPTALIEGRANATGTLTAYFDSETLLEKFINETQTSLRFTLLDSDGVGYRVSLPNVKYTTGDVPVQGEGDIVATLGFQALLDDSTAATGTSMYIDKLV